MNKPGSNWTVMQERGHYWPMKLVYWLYRLGGRWLLYPIVILTVLYFFATRRTTRRASALYLARVMGHKPSRWQVWRHHLAFGLALLDRIAAWMDRIKRTDVYFPGHQLMLELQEQKRGAILLGAHFGNLEMCRAVVENDASLKLNVILHTANTQNFDRLLRSVNERTDVRLIQVTDVSPATAMLLKEKLDQGEFVILLADRLPPVPGARSMTAPLLGDNAEFPAGPFWLALMLGAPVYFMAGFTTDDGYQAVMELLHEGGRVPRRERDAASKALLDNYIARLEYHCRRHPYQWFNFFDFWGDDSAPDNKSSEE
ncbi:MAG TPA: hypothetical protein VIC08_09145 [Cellvibrionaceae bacterium]